MRFDTQFVTQQMAKATPYLGHPGGEFRIEIPATISTPGHDFNLKKTGPKTIYSYPGALGGWFDERDDDPYGIGTINQRAGGCTIFHHQHNVDYATLVAQIKTPGAELFWDGLPVNLNATIEDHYQNSTIIGFSLIRVSP